MAYTSWNPHNAGLAHLFDARTGSSGIGAFYASPCMQIPPSTVSTNNSYFPIYNDSSVWCGGYGYGYNTNAIGPFDAYIQDTTKNSFGKCVKSWFCTTAATNFPGLVGWGLQALGVTANLAGNVSNNAANYFSNFTNKSGSSNLDYVNNSLTNRVFS